MSSMVEESEEDDPFDLVVRAIRGFYAMSSVIRALPNEMHRAFFAAALADLLDAAVAMSSMTLDELNTLTGFEEPRVSH